MFDSLYSLIGALSVFELVESGGPVVAILLVLSVFVTAVILLKIFQFSWIGVGNKRRTNKAIESWLSGNRSKAYDMVARSGNPVDKTLSHVMRGLESLPANSAALREDIDRVAMQQMDKVRSHFRSIEAVVQVAPLLGLFGTVIGMIDAFRTLQDAGSNADPATLAGGIWVALLTTAVGLAIAIPAALVLYWFEGIAEKEHHRMRSAVTSLTSGRVTDKGNASAVRNAAAQPNTEIAGRAA